VCSSPVRRMSAEPVGRRELISKVLGSAALLSATAANADIDYAGVGFLGGSSTIDVNNANVRVYTKVGPAHSRRRTRDGVGGGGCILSLGRVSGGTVDGVRLGSGTGALIAPRAPAGGLGRGESRLPPTAGLRIPD